MKTRFYLLFLTGMVYMLIGGCTEKTENKSVDVRTKAVSYKDSVYLEIEGALYEPEVIWGNSDVYDKAFDRFIKNTRLENDRIVFDCHSAEELNISPNIYEYLFMIFDGMNKKAEEKGWRIKKQNCSYGYDRSTQKQEVNYDIERVVLKQGEHWNNLSKLLGIIDRYQGNLGDVIDFDHSDLKGNGVGDVSISGEIETAPYVKPIPDYLPITGYYCCNACTWNKNGSDCEFNDVMDVRIIQAGPPVEYLSMLNNQGASLITIRNAFYALLLV